MSEETDEILMNKVKEGSLGSMTVLFERYQSPVYNFFVRLTGNVEDSKDLTQSTFYRVTKYRRSYKDRYSFRSWLFKLARNQFHDVYRKNKREQSHFSDDQFDADGANTMDTEAPKARNRFELDDALRQLPDDYRELILMGKYQGLKYEEISQVLGISVGAIKIKMHRAIYRLKEIYNEERSVA